LLHKNNNYANFIAKQNKKNIKKENEKILSPIQQIHVFDGLNEQVWVLTIYN